jgi:hypothetical protein
VRSTVTYEYKIKTEDGQEIDLLLKDYSEVPGRVSLDHIGDMEAQVWASFKWGLIEPRYWPEEEKDGKKSGPPGWMVLRICPMSAIMKMYNDWQSAAKITAPESAASSSS